MLRRLQYRRNNPLQIPHHIVIGEPQHSIAARREPLVAPLVVPKPLLEIVALAVDLDYELVGMCDEIGDVIADWSLTTKAKSREPMRLQVPPQQGFRASHRAS